VNPLNIVILGLSITSSWGNGHATTYRALVRALACRGHQILFLERNRSWYAVARDLPKPPYCRTVIYKNLKELKTYSAAVRAADLVIVGSYVPNGIAVGNWVLNTAQGITAFYDIDTPVTLAMLEQQGTPYLLANMIPRYDIYLSFTGGPILEHLERHYGSPMARALYCAVDTELYRPLPRRVRRWHLGYMGTYCADRQGALESLLLEPARRHCAARMVVAGAQYPRVTDWPKNVEHIEHVRPAAHADFYGKQSFTLNLTRKNMIHAGFSPSVRLFEAAACACPVISDWWEGLDQFFKIGEEILVADSPARIAEYLFDLPAKERRAIGRRARARILAAHTATHRAAELESYTRQIRAGRGAAKDYSSSRSTARFVATPAPFFLPRDAGENEEEGAARASPAAATSCK
jgi:spore maturation protein CgeB